MQGRAGDPVLSRIAEALYWTGRYAERAEDTARLLDVAQRAALEGSDLGTSTTLAAVLGGPVVTGSRQDILAHYGLDRLSPQSIASCVRAARENARQIRDALPSEMWESLNTWHLSGSAASRSDLSGAGAHGFLAGMRTRAYTYTGCAEATMLRTEGWSWLMAGRWLERLSFTTRVLAVRAPTLEEERPGGGPYGWAVLLRALSAYEAYRTTYRAVISPERVVELLLLDPDFPRSARSCAMRLEEALVVVADEHVDGTARRLGGRLHGMLGFGSVDEVIAEGLGRYLDRVAQLTGAVHDALTDEPFARGTKA